VTASHRVRPKLPRLEGVGSLEMVGRGAASRRLT